ncbi:hypothetical protein K2173_004338 [Erythroxylum novogranatense]|uniref:Pentatricopeptide repeat-containing protein n=1 Tax=Erythroxylum novogranatense TaxID=1862640 RepID=A0AAV8T478_9ROSI|nr:hypothetical protein K2173_004338 [Erythroxylum novogranatense]
MATACRRLRGFFITNSKIPHNFSKLQSLVKRFKKRSESAYFRSRRDVYSLTVERLSKSKSYSMIEEIIEHQKKFEDITNESFTGHLISLYGKAGMAEHARNLFDEMPQLNCPRTVYSFNILLSSYIHAGKSEMVIDLAQDLQEKLGVTLDLISYNNVLKALCEMGDLGFAFSLLDEMDSKGLEPSLVTYNTLLNGFYVNKRFADGEKIWGIMQSKNIVPDVRSYNSRLRGLVSRKGVKKAVELLEEMTSKGIKPNVISYNAVIRGFCDEGNIDEAKRWYAKLKEDFSMPDVVTYVTLVPFLCKEGDFDMACELSTEIANRGLIVRAALVQPVVNGLVKQSKLAEAKHLIELWNSSRPSSYKLTSPAKLFSLNFIL